MNRRISAFIAASCLLHAGLLWQTGTDTPALDIGNASSILHVTLTSPAPSMASARQAPATATPTPARASDRERTASRVSPRQPSATAQPRTPQTAAAAPLRRPATERVAAPRPETTATATGDAPSTGSAPTVRQQVSAALQRQLAATFDYPWLARKRGWQGLVTLSLHVAEDGELSHWKVLNTSGYSLLDRSALQSAQRIGRLDQAGKLLNGRSLTLSIPVRYQLLDG